MGADLATSLVNNSIETGQPAAIIRALISQTRKMITEGISIDVLGEALVEWECRPGIPPSYLTHVVSDVLRARRARSNDEAKQKKMRDWETRLNEEMDGTSRPDS
ncbi:hypothetical protein MINTMi27_14810 [Mycobacterium intracellulare]|uniref:hypothetical protein n=1 Tax=Mycobacterium intracellulare TaxID=1767 RepID=UPI00192850B4|nr:hypothetical protein [Mycobacterium intracellulare]BCP41388.1 hypothetical protein MINTMi27_14810 [Mycobacterium intracellulare]